MGHFFTCEIYRNFSHPLFSLSSLLLNCQPHFVIKHNKLRRRGKFRSMQYAIKTQQQYLKTILAENWETSLFASPLNGTWWKYLPFLHHIDYTLIINESICRTYMSFYHCTMNPKKLFKQLYIVGFIWKCPIISKYQSSANPVLNSF